LGQGAGYEWLTLNRCIVIGTFIVMVYTVLGGMWSVALTDMIQTVVIVIGLVVIAWLLAGMSSTDGSVSSGVAKVYQSARDSGRLQLFPSGGLAPWLTFIAGLVTAALGSIPQQDVFQRVTSAKDE